MFFWLPRVMGWTIALVSHAIFEFAPLSFAPRPYDFFDFILRFSIDNIGRRFWVIGPMFCGLDVRREQGSMERVMDPPSRW